MGNPCWPSRDEETTYPGYCLLLAFRSRGSHCLPISPEKQMLSWPGGRLKSMDQVSILLAILPRKI